MLDMLFYAGLVFMGFLAIMNPLSSISIFLTLTATDTEQEAKIIAKDSVITAFSIVVIFVLFGHYLLSFFGISFIALRLAGGILVGLIGYEMLQGKQSMLSKPSNEAIEETVKEENSVAITPLGIPLLAGPAVIITAMNFSAGGFINLITTIFSFGLLCMLTYFFFVWGKQIKKWLGMDILALLTRMMGLILVFIGTQMLVDAVFNAITEFQKINYF